MNGLDAHSTTSAPGKLTRSRVTLVMIFALFALPLALAWLLNFAGDFEPGRTVNSGHLIQPVRPVADVVLRNIRGGDQSTVSLRGKWTLLVRQAGDCDDSCRRVLYVLRQVRLAQGKNIDRVQRLMLLDKAEAPVWADEVAQHFPGLVLAHVASTSETAVFPPAGKIYLVDPLGNLMMEYALDADPRGMIKDLERLLRASYIG